MNQKKEIFFGFELEEVVNKSKAVLVKDDSNDEFELKDDAFFETHWHEVHEVKPSMEESSLNHTRIFQAGKPREPDLVHDRKVYQFDLSCDQYIL